MINIKINERQKKFADEYLLSGDIALAAKIAGYKKSYKINTLLEKPYIKEYLDSHRSSCLVTKEKIISELFKIGFAEMEDAPVKPSDKLKALDAISKITGLDKPCENGGDFDAHKSIINAILMSSK